MLILQLLLTPLLLIASPPDKSVPDGKWAGKLVLIKQASVRFGEFDDKGNLVKPLALTGMEYRILADKDERLQIKTVQGVTGWIKKSDAVLIDDAVGFFSTRIQDNPKDFDAYNRRALSWKIKGEQDQAIKDFTESIRLNANASTYNNRAIAYMAKKDYDNAKTDYDQAIRLNPGFAVFYNNRGALWNAKKDHARAIDDFSAAIRMDPNLALAINNRAFTYVLLKDYNKAIEDYTRVLEIDPLASQAYVGRGNALSRTKEYEKALADFNESLKIAPKYEPACNAAAWLLATCPKESVRDGKRALELAKQATSVLKTNPNYLDTLAAAFAEVGNFDEAVRVQEQVMRSLQFMKDKDARGRLELYKKKQPYRQTE